MEAGWIKIIAKTPYITWLFPRVSLAISSGYFDGAILMGSFALGYCLCRQTILSGLFLRVYFASGYCGVTPFSL